MNRRKYLAALGVLGSGTAAAMGTGAFTSVSASRDVSVSVADDTNGYLGLSASPNENGEFASVDTSSSGDGEIALDFGASDGGGSGVGLNSTYNFDDVFRIENQGTQTIYVWANFSGEDLDDDDIWFYPGSDSDRELNDGSNSVVTLTTGQQVNVGVHIDTSVLSSAENQALTASLTADVDVPSGSQPSGPVGEDAAVVSKDADTGEFDSIQGAINAVDGTTVLVESGRYEESVAIDVDGLTLKGVEGANPTVTQSSGSVVGINADSVTIDGLTVEAGNGTTAVNLNGVSDSAAVTLTDNTIDLTVGNDNSVGIVAGSGSGISETIEDNTFQADADNFLGDGTTPSFVDDGNDRVDFGTILSENTFEPGVVEYEFGALAAAVPVDSNNEFLQALADDRDAGDGRFGGPFALSKSYTDGLDNQSIAGQRDASRGTVRVDIDPADINRDNSYSTPDGDAISGVFITGFDQAAFQNVIISGGQVYIFVPDRLSGEQVTIAVGNFDQTSNPSGWDGLSGDDIVIQNVTIQ
nr:DUF1102 domain-containing protein [Halorubrum ezzemoulense]